MAPVKYNERSWAIDLISSTNQFLNDRNINIKRARGEQTIGGESNLFPDVLLFGDRRAAQILQGWELKMPDTRITDAELIENATQKAKRLGLNSFLIWNVNQAVLYVKGEEEFEPSNNWSLDNEISRDEVENNEEQWLPLFKDILNDLDLYFDQGIISGRSISESFNQGIAAEIVNINLGNDIEALKAKAADDQRFKAKVNVWWDQHKKIYPNRSNKWEILSKTILINWVNKFLFGHILKLSQVDARVLNDLPTETTYDELKEIYENISANCDFWNIFKNTLGDTFISNESRENLLQLNALLSDLDFESVDRALLKELLQTTTAQSRLKAAGQFVTPPILAEILTQLTITETAGSFYDPFCGTGTIVKSAYDLKISSGINQKDALQQVYGSDKFSFPLQIATISLSDPANLGETLKLFQQDAIELNTGLEITLHDPNTGNQVIENLPDFPFISTNLPFVQFESIHETNETVEQINDQIREITDEEVELGGRSDLYAYLPFYLWTILSEDGRLGIIVSNSWLGTEWGINFRNLLRSYFKIEYIITSGDGRWFKDADVVTNILILNKKNDVTNTDLDGQIKFIVLNKSLNSIHEDNSAELISSYILADSQNKELFSVNEYTNENIRDLENLGIYSWSSFFTNIKWLEDFQESLISVSDLFHVERGERRGWDDLFFPEDHDIEEEYLVDCVKSIKGTGSYLIEANSEAFCCSTSLEDLKKNEHTGALTWIEKFKHQTNSNGKPLPNKLDRTNQYWYEMLPEPAVDIVLSLNPDKKLYYSKLEDPTFINQRAIGFKLIDDSDDIDLLHALMNSILGLFYIEANGFGRGLGALDLNKTKMENLHILNPELLSPDQIQDIKEAFAEIVNNDIENLETELEISERIQFDKTVLAAYELEDKYDDIKSALLQLYRIRQTVR